MDDLRDNVDYFKGDSNSPVLSSDEDYEFDIEGVSKESIEEVAAKYYQLLKNYISYNPELFPNESDNTFADEPCDGLRFADKHKIQMYGENAYGISKKFLKDFWDASPYKQNSVKKVWVKIGAYVLWKG
ncbi:hypothetical protein [Paenibacillus amylolyticus]|uniref:hypothetical protein n=1 Tax=Paenibacillus amylolyticus TaxID=1451 RepID=UPI00249CA32E|nr:hypothetical protein [Paenibacillus amylolyticus]WFA88044.1 hypothetical protein OGI70_14490 [Paenibacillus amylolyticus]